MALSGEATWQKNREVLDDYTEVKPLDTWTDPDPTGIKQVEAKERNTGIVTLGKLVPVGTAAIWN